MTRILYWNLSNFSMPKIHDTTSWITSSEAFSRESHILEVMRGPAGGPIPDIIVVVEVYSRVREVGVEGTALDVGSDAAQAVLRLLAKIRADATLGAAGTNWCVVPPLNLGELGQREAVAVFYNATTIQFTGPNLFYQLYPPPPVAIGQSQPVAQATYAAMTPYPAPWLGAMPALGRTTNFPAINQTIAENQLAGEWQYYTTPPNRPVPSSPTPPPANRLQFPNNGCRGPFYTRFLDLGANRTINLFSIHTSPATARGAIQRLASVPEISAVSAGEVNVLLGDFNIDTFSPAADAYTNLLAGTGGIYTLELDPRVAHAGNAVPARKPYCMTHLLPAGQATPYNNTNGAPTDPQHNVYPRAGYMGSSFRGINDSGAIDNVLTAYGGGGPAANITVVNTLTGTPYSKFNPPPQGVTAELTGGLNFPSTLGAKMLTAIPPATQGVGGIQPGSPGAGFYANLFQSWDYMGKRFSTSDHLPLVIDV